MITSIVFLQFATHYLTAKHWCFLYETFMSPGNVDQFHCLMVFVFFSRTSAMNPNYTKCHIAKKAYLRFWIRIGSNMDSHQVSLTTYFST